MHATFTYFLSVRVLPLHCVSQVTRPLLMLVYTLRVLNLYCPDHLPLIVEARRTLLVLMIFASVLDRPFQ